MSVKQILVSLENVPGKLLEVSEILGAEGINIRAISMAETAHVNTVRLVTDNPEKASNVLKSRGYMTQEVEVIAVEIPDHPGGLQAVLKPLKRRNINVLYLYPYLGRGESNQAILVLGVDNTEKALQVLQKNWVRTYGKEVYAL
jgi:hypothetical protein